MKELVRTSLTAILLLAGAAFAQIDDQARALLEGYAAQGETTADFQAMDMTSTMTIYGADEPISTQSRTVIDYAGERAAIISNVMGMTTTMRFVDGTMTMVVGGMSLPMPPGMDSAFADIFETGTANDLLEDPNAVATYDGEVSYGDVLSGQQVTYTGDFGVPGMQMDASTMRFVFDDSGRLLGMVVPEDGLEMVMVYVGEPKIDGALFYDLDMYQISGGTATLYAEMRYSDIKVNEPIDETVFE